MKDGENLLDSNGNQNLEHSRKHGVSFPYALYGGIGAIFVTLCLSFFLRKGWMPLLSYLLAVNLGAVLFFGYDKLISPFPGAFFRVPELLLHCFSFAGGAPGSLLASRIFRHKSSKPSFFIVEWVALGCNILVVGAYLYYQRN